MKPNNIYNQDCLEFMRRQIPDRSIDLILQDPPYAKTSLDWDEQLFLPDFWMEWERIIKPNGAIIFTSCQPFTSHLILSNLKLFRQEIIWEKEKPTNFFHLNKQIGNSHENIILFYKSQPTYNPQKIRVPDWMIQARRDYDDYEQKEGTVITGEDKFKLRVKKDDGTRYPTSIISISRDRKNKHPTAKPVELFSWIIRTFTNKDNVVFDGFIGSGTTAIACIKEKRQFIGCELNAEYYELATQRIKDEQHQLFLF